MALANMKYACAFGFFMNMNCNVNKRSGSNVDGSTKKVIGWNVADRKGLQDSQLTKLPRNK
jgi:hypothetical protein